MNSNRKLSAVVLTACLTLSAAARSEDGPPDPQMQAVLDELAAFDGKPIEKLSPE